MNAIPPRIPTTDNLLARQSADTEAFVAAVKHLVTVTEQLAFPLGSPVQGYDICDVLSHLRDWQIPTDPRTIEWAAADVVAEDRFCEGQSRNEARLVGE